MNDRPRSRYLVLQKEIPPQQADLIVKRNFQGVYAEKVISVTIHNLNPMRKLLV
jgi:cell division protein FtsI (penicillin-binding protein 3)